MYLKLPIKTFYLSLFLLAHFSFANCAQESFLSFKGEINSDNINIRQDSTVNAPIICNVDKDSRVEVISDFYEWYRIRLPKFAPSYIKKSLVECIFYEEPQINRACQNGRVLKDRVNVRLSPNENSPILGQIDKNETVNIIQEESDWYKIEPIKESFGWIHKKFVSPVTTEVEEPVNETSSPKDNKIKDIAAPEESITVNGLITPYGKIIKRIATHKLLSADKEVFLLKGEKRSLDAYNYRKAKVTGKRVVLPKQKYPLIEVKILEEID